MNHKSFITLLSAMISILCSAQDKTTVIVADRVENKSITIDGNLDDWKTTPLIIGLVEPWLGSQRDSTRFYACRDAEFLYLLFDVTEESLYYSIAEEERSVDNSDRIEFFICKDSLMHEYYCMEITPHGKVMDYKAEYYRKFDYEWTFDTLVLGTDIDDRKYYIEAAIPIKWLKRMGLISDDSSIIFGVFRADFIEGEKSMINWYTWIDPSTRNPEFHVPAALGRLIL